MMKTKVLIVDDERTFADLLAERLEIRDFDVTVALDGETAIHLIQKQDFDVVLLDVFMPGQGGIETLKKIKTIKPMIDIIMLTGHASVGTAIEGMELGAYDYLLKPVQIDELEEKIGLARYHKAVVEERLRQGKTAVYRRGRGNFWGLISNFLGRTFKGRPKGPG